MKNKTFWQSICCAARGMKIGFKSEKNLKIYLGYFITFMIFNILLKSSIIEICILILVSSGMFALEYVNTTIEYICDNFTQEFNDKIGVIKDLAAAGVLSIGVGFWLTQASILIPKFVRLFL